MSFCQPREVLEKEHRPGVKFLESMRGQFLLGLLLAALVLLFAGWYAEVPRLLAAAGRWRWAYLPVVLLAVLAGLALRFLRWQYLLSAVVEARVAPAASGIIFLAGFSLTTTPGKLGELLKSLLLKRLNNTPVSRSAPVVFVERLTDLLAMLLLACAGFAVYHVGIWIPAGALLILFPVFVLQRRGFVGRLFGLGERIPRCQRVVQYARSLYESTYLLLRWSLLAKSVVLATFGWLCEGLAFFLIIWGMGASPDFPRLLRSVFIYSATTLFGAISFLPGGLGATEGSMTLLLQKLERFSREEAVAATLLLRFATLWFGVAIGVLALAAFQFVRKSDAPDTGEQLSGDLQWRKMPW